MIDSNIKIKILFGEDIYLENIGTLKSFKLKEIKDIGFDIYNQNIGVLCITKDDIDEMFDYELEEPVEPFDFIIQNCIHGNDDMRDSIIYSWEMIFDEHVGLCNNGYFFLGDISENRFITRENFDEIVSVIKEMNCVQENKNRAKPKNEAQKRYFKKRKEVRAMKANNKKQDNEMLHIISAVCAKHNSYNLFNISDLTIYQLIDQYKRLCSIEEYSINFQSLMHGASGDNVKIKHWSEPMV